MSHAIKVPRQEQDDEFADPLESVGEQADGVDQREKNNAQMRQIRPGVAAETGLNPLGAGEDIGAAHPAAEEHHQENLVERRPQPRQPEAFQAINEQNINQPHRPADVEHARGVGDSQQVPRQRLAAEKVGIHVLGPAPRNPEADQDDRQKIDDDNDNIQTTKVHIPPGLLFASGETTQPRRLFPEK